MQTVTINKISQSREIEFDKLPENTQAFIINYGLRQVLNDRTWTCRVYFKIESCPTNAP